MDRASPLQLLSPGELGEKAPRIIRQASRMSGSATYNRATRPRTGGHKRSLRPQSIAMRTVAVNILGSDAQIVRQDAEVHSAAMPTRRNHMPLPGCRRRTRADARPQ